MEWDRVVSLIFSGIAVVTSVTVALINWRKYRHDLAAASRASQSAWSLVFASARSPDGWQLMRLIQADAHQRGFELLSVELRKPKGGKLARVVAGASPERRSGQVPEIAGAALTLSTRGGLSRSAQSGGRFSDWASFTFFVLIPERSKSERSEDTRVEIVANVEETSAMRRKMTIELASQATAWTASKPASTE